MSSPKIPWLPEGGIYLEKVVDPPARPHRPWSQGDIFAAVAIFLADGKADAPKAKPIVGHALLIGHTCSMRGGRQVASIQNVCAVRPAKETETEELAARENSFRQLFPLPGLIGDELWVADFNRLGSVKFTHLKSKRIACLNHDGWASLQLRYAYHSTRIEQRLEERIEDTRPTWIEVELWEEWCRRSHAEPDFQTWLDEPACLATDPGLTRRKALTFLPDVIRDQMPE